eukprot:m.132349 g.132349  ORF g.132349 m.132349 type:complete len:330 (+) comp15774_c0_seq1:1214-2203(+)
MTLVYMIYCWGGGVSTESTHRQRRYMAFTTPCLQPVAVVVYFSAIPLVVMGALGKWLTEGLDVHNTTTAPTSNSNSSQGVQEPQVTDSPENGNHLNVGVIIGLISGFAVVALLVAVAYKSYTKTTDNDDGNEAESSVDVHLNSDTDLPVMGQRTKMHTVLEESVEVVQTQRRLSASNVVQPRGTLYTVRAPSIIEVASDWESSDSWDCGDTVISINDGIYSNVFGKRQIRAPLSDLESDIHDYNFPLPEDLAPRNATPEAPHYDTPDDDPVCHHHLHQDTRLRHSGRIARPTPRISTHAELHQNAPKLEVVLRTGNVKRPEFHLESAIA